MRNDRYLKPFIVDVLFDVSILAFFFFIFHYNYLAVCFTTYGFNSAVEKKNQMALN